MASPPQHARSSLWDCWKSGIGVIVAEWRAQTWSIFTNARKKKRNKDLKLNLKCLRYIRSYPVSLTWFGYSTLFTPREFFPPTHSTASDPDGHFQQNASYPGCGGGGGAWSLWLDLISHPKSILFSPSSSSPLPLVLLPPASPSTLPSLLTLWCYVARQRC